ncbi:MAG: acyl-[acyl-carrier-protein]--UDP-N-acetylglucosamine O-acyltransferase [Candidatus Angelobacter sp.]|nr:acyl-[acyl-carrier-protein]--UDP-N-acetylglucosamine O-acyltransferase [Candidatus Angelobacter sp.]
MIHPTALIDSRAQVHPTCTIGPFCIVGPGVELGEHCELISHVVIHGPAKIGAHNRFFPFCAIGGEPQDLSYKGEETRLEIGSHNVVREYVTLNRGTAKGGGITKIGDHTLLMAYVHVGHDSVIGDHAMLVYAATLAGHVTVEEWAVVGALCAIHQFTRVGAHAYIGAGTIITKDVLPFSKCVSPRDVRTYGLNAVGLQRRGFSEERIGKIHHAFRVLLNSKLNTTQALEKLRSENDRGEDVEMLLRFIEDSERGIIK